MREANPLTPDELRRFKSTARKMSRGYRLVGHIIPETGLRPVEYRHFHQRWIKSQQSVTADDHDPDSFVIDVQAAPCEGTIRFATENKHERGPRLEERTESCVNCREGIEWTPNFSCYARRIPVVDEAAVETIAWWFDRYDSIPSSDTRVCHYVKKIAEKAGIDDYERVTTFTLRDTFGVRLLKSGVDIDEVTRLMGYSRRTLLKPLMEHTDRTHHWKAGGFIPDEALLEELQRLAEAVHRAPKRREMDKRGAYGSTTYIDRFGGWNAALRQAGFQPNRKSTRPASDRELLADLQRLAEELGRRPTQADVEATGRYSYQTYLRRLDGLRRARKLAGLEE